jgi:hypothetical protein
MTLKEQNQKLRKALTELIAVAERMATDKPRGQRHDPDCPMCSAVARAGAVLGDNQG